MMNNTLIKILFSLFLLASLAACSLLPQAQNGSATGNPVASANGITASGTIQVDSTRLSPEISGKIKDINVQQGDLVQSGAVVFQLDDSLLQTQRKQATAALQAAQAAQAAAQANLDLIKAGATADQLRAAQAQLEQVDANRSAAQANLWNIEGSTRPEEITAAQARLDLARKMYYQLNAALDDKQINDAAAVLNEAKSDLSLMQDRHDRLAQNKQVPTDALEAAANTISDAKLLVDYANQASQSVQDDSQPLYLQIASVRKTWEAAQLNLSQAQARQTALRAENGMPQDALDAAQSAVDSSQALVTKAKQAYDSINTSSQATRLQSAWDEMQNAQRDFNALGRGAASGTSLETVLNQYTAMTAQHNAAEANYNALKNSPRPEQVSNAQAQLDAATAKVAEAQAALDSIDVQINKLVVTAPQGGVILNRSLDPGEIAPAGSTVVEIGNLDQVKLKVYVPEDQYGQIKLGQTVSVKVDSFPGKVFSGKVTNIANQAEFTPRNVQTQDTRSTTVYAIEIQLPNPNHALKPGMPADATF